MKYIYDQYLKLIKLKSIFTIPTISTIPTVLTITTKPYTLKRHPLRQWNILKIFFLNKRRLTLFFHIIYNNVTIRTHFT